jgi:hypothetical protein
MTYRVVRFKARHGVRWFNDDKATSVIGVARGDALIKHGHELRNDGVGCGELMTWSDTEMGCVRATMYKNLLNAKER